MTCKPKPAIKLGLTGGIGSGKSTVAALLAQWGAVVVDADAISRRLTAPQGLAITDIVAEFGAEALNPDGSMNRDTMRERVYGNTGVRQRLEAIIHPLVAQQTQQQADAASQAGARCIVFDVPLLVESGHWRQKVDQVLVVDCTPERQMERVMARNGLSRASIEGILATQATRGQRLRAADSVIFNDGLSMVQLKEAVRQLVQRSKLSFPLAIGPSENSA